MDELSMFTTLRPSQDPVDVTGARTRLTAAIAGAPGRPAFGGKRLALTGGIAATAAAAAVVAMVLPTATPRTGGSQVTEAAWTVDLKQDGTVTLTIQQVFANLDGLQQTLRSDGVYATVALIPWKISHVNGGIQAIQSCGYGRYIAKNSAPVSVQHAVITHPEMKTIYVYAGKDSSIVKKTGTGPDPSTWIIHPGAMPRGSVLFIVASPTVKNENVGGAVGNPVILRGERAAVCAPGDDVASQWGSR
jgi:hypothetical protein